MSLPLLPFVTPGEISTIVQSGIRDFIKAVTANDLKVRWPGYNIPILRGDLPVTVKNGSSWLNEPSSYPNEIYAYHDPIYETPRWVPQFLSCVAITAKINEEEDIKRSIFDMLCRMAADLFRGNNDSIMSTFGGMDLTRFAINFETNQLAGEYPPVDPSAPVGDENVISVWRMAVSGEPVDVQRSNWVQFTI